MPVAPILARRQQIPKLKEVVNADDDWTGLTNAAARRKRQNRLNVRAYRKHCRVFIRLS